MGQAKLRGSFEVRKAEGQAKSAAESLERKRLAEAREASMTPAQLKSREKTRAIIAAAMGLSVDGWY